MKFGRIEFSACTAMREQTKTGMPRVGAVLQPCHYSATLFLCESHPSHRDRCRRHPSTGSSPGPPSVVDALPQTHARSLLAAAHVEHRATKSRRSACKKRRVGGRGRVQGIFPVKRHFNPPCSHPPLPSTPLPINSPFLFCPTFWSRSPHRDPGKRELLCSKAKRHRNSPRARILPRSRIRPHHGRGCGSRPSPPRAAALRSAVRAQCPV
jgi:hypothetical protein